MAASATRREKTEQLKVEDVMQQQRDDAVFLQWEAATHRVPELLERTREELLLEMKEILGFRNHEVCMKEAALLDYYVCGFWWAKEANFTPPQTSFTMALLHLLLDNIREKQMVVVDNLKECTHALGSACCTSEDGNAPLLNKVQAMSLVCYVRNSLFQKYRLYELLFSTSREERLMGTERTVEVFGPDPVTPLEENISTLLHIQ